MKKVIYLILAFVLCTELNAQTVVCLNTPISVSVSASSKTLWNLRDRRTNGIVNSSGTLAYSGDQSFYPWNTKRTNGGGVILTITGLTTTGSTLSQYRLEWTNFNFFGGNVGGGHRDFDVVALTSLAQPSIAPIAGNPLDANCNIVIGVTNPQQGVNYSWNNGGGGATGTTNAIQATYSSLSVAAICTASSCALPSVASTPGVPPTGFPPPVISLVANNNNVCVGQQVAVTASAVEGCFGTSWEWFSDGGYQFFFTNSSGVSSTAYYAFNAPGAYTITAKGTNFVPGSQPTESNSVVINVVPANPDCSIFELKSNTGGVSLKGQKAAKGDVILFPNPVSDILRLDQLQDYNNLRVVDQYGKVLNTQPIVEGETQKSLNVSQFTNGLYFIQFTNKTGEVTTEKFQVIH